MHRTLAVLVTLLVANCSSSSSRDDTGEAPPTIEELRTMSQQAADQTADPGDRLLSVPASLPGVKQWTVSLGQSLTVLGLDDAGDRRAIVTWVPRDTGFAIACSTDDTSAAACARIEQAIQADLRRMSGVSPAALRPLDDPPLTGSSAKCVSGIEAGLAQIPRVEAKKGAGAPDDPSTVVICNNSSQVDRVWPGACWTMVLLPTSGSTGPMRDKVQWGLSNHAMDLAAACCPDDVVPDEAARTTLLKRHVTLLCSLKPPPSTGG